MEKRKRAVRWLFFLFSGNTFSKAWWIYLKKKVIIFLCFAGIFLMKTCLYNPKVVKQLLKTYFVQITHGVLQAETIDFTGYIVLLSQGTVIYSEKGKITQPPTQKKTTLQREMQGRFFVLRTILSLHKHWIQGIIRAQSPWSRGHALAG